MLLAEDFSYIAYILVFSTEIYSWWSTPEEKIWSINIQWNKLQLIASG